jgi:hypothetical protein
MNIAPLMCDNAFAQICIMTTTRHTSYPGKMKGRPDSKKPYDPQLTPVNSKDAKIKNTIKCRVIRMRSDPNASPNRNSKAGRQAVILKINQCLDPACPGSGLSLARSVVSHRGRIVTIAERFLAQI